MDRHDIFRGLITYDGNNIPKKLVQLMVGLLSKLLSDLGPL